MAIAGLAGTGKTTLAVHWAYRVAERFPGGQFYLDLSGYRDGGDGTAAATRPLAVLLRALGVPPDQIPVAANDAATLYRSLLAGRRILVLLDNAVSAAQVRPLLAAGPGCMSLVIGRSRLDGLIALDRAYHFPLSVLTQSEAVALLTTFVGEAAGRGPARLGRTHLAPVRTPAARAGHRGRPAHRGPDPRAR